MKKFKKLFFMILLVLSLFLICGCTNNTIKETDNFKIVSCIDLPNKEKTNISINRESNNKINEFAYHSYLNIINDNCNSIYSPLSMYMALSMLSEGSKNETYEELKTCLGFDSLIELREINKKVFENNYYDNNNGMMKLANSYWVDLDFTLLDTFTNTLKNDYYASGYKGCFDDEMINNICKWINNNTFDFLNIKSKDLEELKSCSLALINTIYFNNKWEKEFKKSNTKTNDFFNNEGIIKADYMYHNITNSYIESKNFISVKDNFLNGNKITYVMPNENIGIDDVINSNEFYNLITNNVIQEQKNIDIFVPKFKLQNEINGKEILEKINVKRIFDPLLCDLSNMSGTSSYIDFIKQIAGIELNEEGVRAAAVTIIGDTVTSYEPIETIVIKLNRPFIYYITDSNDTILFIGYINNPTY